jgi:Fe-S-cluster containining protein
MTIDYKPFFGKYEALAAMAEKAFAQVSTQFNDCVRCNTGCSDCCYALFDISLIEALYIHHHFRNTVDDAVRETLLEKANEADRKIYKIKRKAYRAAAGGRDEAKILATMSTERVRCPLLNDADRCDLYPYRPMTCRLYGIPTAINGEGQTCGLSGFEPGKPYPTVNIDIFYRRLYELSLEFVKTIRSRHIKMAEMLIPLSMALITDFDDEYLGIGKDEEKDEGSGA